MKKYYLAYEERYKQIHKKGLLWEVEGNSQIVENTIKSHNITKQQPILDLGVGEGRDSIFLLEKGYNVTGVDCSQEAIKTCIDLANKKNLNHNFKVLDLVKENLNQKFDFIYSIAVLHMLCKDEDRKAFFKFIKNHLSNKGIALICVMGDGKQEYVSDFNNAFNIVKRYHHTLQKEVEVSATSLKMVSKDYLLEEVKQSNLKIKDYFVTDMVAGFKEMMAVIVSL